MRLRVFPVALRSAGLVLGFALAGAAASAQRVAPPQVKSLPGVQLPDGVPVPDSGVVRVLVRIDTDGTATVEECDAEAALCDLVSQAMADAEFVPAMREDTPVVSRTRVELRVRAPPADQVAGETAAAAVLEAERARMERELVYGETAEVVARVQVPIRLELEGIRSIPGTFGEPFRILEVMPGTVPVANGQPYVYVRGAPPSGTVYLYDEIPIPLLFHSALGPATLHSGLIGGIDLYSAVPPARYGRNIGAVVSGRAARIPEDRVHGEAELRAIDVAGMLNVPMPKEGSMTLAGRFGFPNLLLGAIGVDADVNYWDYTYRTGVAMSPRSRFEVVALGGRDSSAFDAANPEERLAFDLQFHRFEARFLGKLDRWDVVGTMLYGYDFSDVEDASGSAVSDASADIHRFGPRFWAIYQQPKLHVRLGGDLEGLFGPANCDSRRESGEIPTIPSVSAPCDPAFAMQDRRLIGGVFTDLMVSPASWVDLSLGVRADMWNTSGYRDAAVSPRLRATFHGGDIADVFVGWGLGARPATFAIPLPGLGDVPLEPGLQHANQTEGGVRFFLPRDVKLETRGYLNVYRDLRFVDIFTNPQITAGTPENPIPAGSLEDSADGKSYGLELLLERSFDAEVSALVSYTLGFSDLTATGFLIDGSTQSFDYTPSYDVRHVMNGVLRWHAKFGLILAARVFARSGRAEGWLWVDSSGTIQQYLQRVPWFTRLDATIAYEWSKPGRRMRVSLEWINITQARDAQEIDSTNPSAPLECQWRVGVPAEDCPIRFTSAIWYPNLSFRAIF